jgi:hypothetical protein
MTARSLAQQANALITKYVTLYKEKYGKPPTINRYRERWGFQSIIEDLGRDDANKVVVYYLSLRKIDHTIPELLRSYDELHKNRLADEKDLKDREKLRIETARRVKEYLERNGK